MTAHEQAQRLAEGLAETAEIATLALNAAGNGSGEIGGVPFLLSFVPEQGVLFIQADAGLLPGAWDESPGGRRRRMATLESLLSENYPGQGAEDGAVVSVTPDGGRIALHRAIALPLPEETEPHLSLLLPPMVALMQAHAAALRERFGDAEG